MAIIFGIIKKNKKKRKKKVVVVVVVVGGARKVKHLLLHTKKGKRSSSLSQLRSVVVNIIILDRPHSFVSINSRPAVLRQWYSPSLEGIPRTKCTKVCLLKNNVHRGDEQSSDTLLVRRAE